MKKLILPLLILLSFASFGQTTTTISNLPRYNSKPTGGIVPVVISGTTRGVPADLFAVGKVDSVKYATDSTFTANALASINSQLSSFATTTALTSGLAGKANTVNPVFSGIIKIGSDTAATKQDVRTGAGAVDLSPYKLKNDTATATGYATRNQVDTAKAAIRAAIPAVTGINTGDENTTRINTLYGYTPANPAVVVKYTDTANIVANYAKTSVVTAGLASKLSPVDTVAKFVSVGKYSADSLKTAASLPINPTFYGTIYNSNNWTGLTDFTNNGSTSSVSGNKIVFSGGANNLNQSLDITGGTMLEKWRISGKFKIGSKTSTDYGFGVGIRSTNTVSALNLSTQFFSTNDAQSGKLNLYVNTNAISSATNLSFSVNDYILLTVERNGPLYTATATNVTAGGSVSASYTVDPFGTLSFNNTGRFAVYSLGGSFTLDSLNVTSKVPTNATTLVIGDSKSQGFPNLAMARRYDEILGQYYFPLVITAGSADRLVEVLTRTSEIIALKPKQVLMAIGCNDFHAGRSQSAIFADYDTLTNRLTAAGIRVIHLLSFYETFADLSSLVTHIQSTYNATDIIDTYTPLLNCATCLNSDGVHPNDQGDQLIVKTILDANKITGMRRHIDISTLTQGALLAGVSDGVANVVAPGVIGQVLSVDTATANPTKMKWATPATASISIGSTIGSGLANSILYMTTSAVLANVNTFGYNATSKFFYVGDATSGQATLSVNKNTIGVTQSDAYGISLKNGSAATVGAQQMSPPIVFEGAGWKTTATAGAQNVKAKIEMLPVQGAANPTANLQFNFNINSAGYASTPPVTFTSGGSIGVGVLAPVEKIEVAGNVKLTTAGNKLFIATGTNASVGTSTLAAGTVTVSTTAALTASKVFVTVVTPGGTQGFLSVPTIVNGTSFTITSTSNTETSTVNWWIVN